MASIIWTPSSCQLTLALNYGNVRVPACVKTATKPSRDVKVLCVPQNADVRRDFGGWNGSRHSGAWNGWDDDEKSGESRGENWLKGTLIAGAAGVILAVGLTVASLSLKSNVLRPKNEVVPTLGREASSDEFSTGNEGDSSDVRKASEASDEMHMSSMEFHKEDKHTSHITNRKRSFHCYKGIPAPSTAPQAYPEKLLSPTVVDPVQGQIYAALQALGVVGSDALPYDICTRREFARWLVSASNALSRSKVYPAMYIENVTELAFDDITPADPDFPFIQGLAEAGLISSKLSNGSTSQFLFFPESPLSRQDLLSWKMAFENQRLPEADHKKLYQISGFLDIDKINPEAWPALMADLSAGEQGIVALAFGRTRLFQPCKAVTKAQAAVALALGEAFDVVSEELARIEAESMAEKVVSAHDILVARVEKDINDSFEEELFIEKEKVEAVEKMAEEAKLEAEKLRARNEEETKALEEERIGIESEMEALSKQRNELEEQLQGLLSNKAEISYEKERLAKLQNQVEYENNEIPRLLNELEAERNALSTARDWAEEEAKRAREQGKVLEEARGRWKELGIKIVVDSDLHEQTTAEPTWLNAGNRFSIEGTIKRAGHLIEKLKRDVRNVGEKPRGLIYQVIEKVRGLISILQERVREIRKRGEELKEMTWSKTEHLMKETTERIRETGDKAKELKVKAWLKAEEAKEQASLRVEEIRNATIRKVEEARGGAWPWRLDTAVKDGVKRVSEEYRAAAGKLAEKFKTT